MAARTLPTLPGYELYFAPLEVSLNPTELEKIQFAYQCSKFGHGMQTRKDDVTRYFDHPKGSGWCYIHEFGGRNVRVIIDTLLHDLGEDSKLLSLYRLTLNFGEEIALDVRALTKLPKGKETIEEYLARVTARGPETILAKLLDRLHNLRDIAALSPADIAKMAKETEEYHLPILIKALRDCGGEWAAIANKMEQKMKEALAALKG